MLGHLVPCSGGTSILLQRERVYLGRRPGADPQAPLGSDTAVCRLRLADGWWHIEGLHAPTPLRVNGTACGCARRLKPNDEVAIGRSRYRIVYVAPEDAQAALEQLAESVLFAGAPLRQPIRNMPDPHLDRREPSAVATRPMAVPAAALAAATTGMLGRLVPLGGGPDYPLLKPRITIGRKSSCDVALRYTTVSSMHCGLELTDGYWRVLDLGSRNGIRVDGVKCQKAWLYPESRLSVAEHRFQVEYTPTGERPEPEADDPRYKQPLMAKLGIKDRDLDAVLARHGLPEPDEGPERKRWDLTKDM
jgi:hypothetical protein